jgi:hypothetical protein
MPHTPTAHPRYDPDPEDRADGASYDDFDPLSYGVGDPHHEVQTIRLPDDVPDDDTDFEFFLSLANKDTHPAQRMSNDYEDSVLSVTFSPAVTLFYANL